MAVPFAARRALPARRLAALGATRGIIHGLPRRATRAVPTCPRHAARLQIHHDFIVAAAIPDPADPPPGHALGPRHGFMRWRPEGDPPRSRSGTGTRPARRTGDSRRGRTDRRDGHLGCRSRCCAGDGPDRGGARRGAGGVRGDFGAAGGSSSRRPPPTPTASPHPGAGRSVPRDPRSCARASTDCSLSPSAQPRSESRRGSRRWPGRIRGPWRARRSPCLPKCGSPRPMARRCPESASPSRPIPPPRSRVRDSVTNNDGRASAGSWTLGTTPAVLLDRGEGGRRRDRRESGPASRPVRWRDRRPKWCGSRETSRNPRSGSRCRCRPGCRCSTSTAMPSPV